MIEPGPKLDALIAEKVFGWTKENKPRCDCTLRESCQFCDFPGRYSTSIADAWQVVEKLKLIKGLYNKTDFITIDYVENKWRCSWMYSYESYRYECQSDTAPHAICLAALKAVGVEV